jgi:UDP-N-acetylmuramyl pentapeptide phosphotransferase/UDP-N-acetylglucosamine-1-phosphate transferase
MEFAPLAASSLASFVVAEGLVITASQHGRFTMDLPGAIQKFHARPTPRVGGIGIYLAILLASALATEPEAVRLLQTVLIAGSPALGIGLLEDVTKRVGVASRLAATLASGVAACLVGGSAVSHVDVPGVDLLLSIAPVAVIFTAVCISGVTNSINIIDGFNGLASGTTAIGLAAFAIIAASVGDVPLMISALLLAAALCGFWLVNFPWGKLFLGDGGAYFSGFALAFMAVQLPMRNADVSPWASLLICAYPVIEALYSIARRWSSRRSPADADREHLHSLIASRVVQPRLSHLDPALQNAAVSVLMWVCAAIPALLGVALYESTARLAVAAVACLLLYHYLYRQVARK